MTNPVTWRENGVVGKYTLLAKLAKGGMGEIYLAQLRGVAGFEKLVVIKRLLPHLAENQHFVAMLLDEARIVARLSHPNVCQVHELNVESGEYFIVMEYLEGVSLLELLRRHAQSGTRTDPRLAAAVIAQACEGLHAAHELRAASGSPTNLVHRDISPSNLFVTASGTLKVLDFGIAKTPDKLVTTRTGAVKGKWAYMSPEQVLRQPLDRRSDIFSLGIVMFEALSGRRLFRRRSEYETCHAITERDAPPLAKYRPDISDELRAVVMRALSRPRQRRYATAREMGRALTEACAPLGGLMSNAEISDYLQARFQAELDERREFIKSVTSVPLADGTGIALRALPTAPHADEMPSDEGDPGVEDAFDAIGGGDASGPEFAAESAPTVTAYAPPREADDDAPDEMDSGAATRVDMSAIPPAEGSWGGESSSGARAGGGAPWAEAPWNASPASAGLSDAAGEPWADSAPAGSAPGDDGRASSAGQHRAADASAADDPEAFGSVTWLDGPQSPDSAPDAGAAPGSNTIDGTRPDSAARSADAEARDRPGTRWGTIVLAAFAAGGVVAGVFLYLDRRQAPTGPSRVVVYEGSVVGDDPAPDPAGDAAADTAADAADEAGDAGDAGDADSADAAPSDASGAASPARGRQSPDKRPRPRPSQKRDGAYYTRIVGRQQRRLLACLDEHRAQITGIPRLSLDLRIETTGRVSSVKVQPPSLGQTEVARCLSKVVQPLAFGRHKDPVNINVPLRVRRTPN